MHRAMLPSPLFIKELLLKPVNALGLRAEAEQLSSIPSSRYRAQWRFTPQL